MCGRYAAAQDTDALVEQFAVEEVVEPAPAANFNVAPTATVPMIVAAHEDGHRQLRTARWGLVPSWSKDTKIGPRMINARWESLESKPAFRVPYAKRRALLPADGYYEWYRVAGAGKAVKQPYFIHSAGPQALAMAALFDFWRPDPAAPWLVSVAVVTTAATGRLAELHDRVPLLLPDSAYAAWLDRHAAFDPGLIGAQDGRLSHQLVALAAHPVGLAVNSVANNGPELLAPVAGVPGPDLGGQL